MLRHTQEDKDEEPEERASLTQETTAERAEEGKKLRWVLGLGGREGVGFGI